MDKTKQSTFQDILNPKKQNLNENADLKSAPKQQQQHPTVSTSNHIENHLEKESLDEDEESEIFEVKASSNSDLIPNDNSGQGEIIIVRSKTNDIIVSDKKQTSPSNSTNTNGNNNNTNNNNNANNNNNNKNKQEQQQQETQTQTQQKSTSPPKSSTTIESDSPPLSNATKRTTRQSTSTAPTPPKPTTQQQSKKNGKNSNGVDQSSEKEEETTHSASKSTSNGKTTTMDIDDLLGVFKLSKLELSKHSDSDLWNLLLGCNQRLSTLNRLKNQIEEYLDVTVPPKASDLEGKSTTTATTSTTTTTTAATSTSENNQKDKKRKRGASSDSENNNSSDEESETESNDGQNQPQHQQKKQKTEAGASSSSAAKQKKKKESLSITGIVSDKDFVTVKDLVQIMEQFRDLGTLAVTTYQLQRQVRAQFPKWLKKAKK